MADGEELTPSPDTNGHAGERAPIGSALPSVGARVLAFGAIVVAGLCGGLIGWKVTVLSFSGPDDGLIPGLGALIGALVGAGGVAIAAVLVLRAMTEWSVIVETGDPSAGRRATRERQQG